MKPLSPEEQAKFKRRLKLSRQENERTKLEMIEAAHAAKHTDLMPEYLWPDVTMDAWHQPISSQARKRPQCGTINGQDPEALQVAVMGIIYGVLDRAARSRITR